MATHITFIPQSDFVSLDMAKSIKKKRAEKYENKLAVKASFEEVFKVVKDHKEQQQKKAQGSKK